MPKIRFIGRCFREAFSLARGRIELVLFVASLVGSVYIPRWWENFHWAYVVVIVFSCILLWEIFVAAPYRMVAAAESQVEGLSRTLSDRRPAMSCGTNASRVSTNLWHNLAGQLRVFANINFYYTNTGNATAVNPVLDIYYCWVNDPSRVLKESSNSIGETPPNHFLNIPWSVDRPAERTGTSPNGEPLFGFGGGDERGLYIFAVLQYHVGTEDGPIDSRENRLFWFRESPNLVFPTAEVVGLTDTHVRNFRRSESS